MKVPPRITAATASAAMNVVVVVAVMAAVGIASRFAAAQPAKDVVAGAIMVPRYYRVAVSGTVHGLDGSKTCMGGEAARRMLDTFSMISKDPKAMAELGKDCTIKSSRQGGFVSISEDCGEAGTAFTSHMRLSGTINEIHEHIDTTMKGLGPNGADLTSVSDVVMTYMGDCPANVKPGQTLKSDGTIFDLGKLWTKALHPSDVSPK